MSTALRIASVTQVLKDLLSNGLIDHDIPGNMGEAITVTAWPPDKIDVSPGKEISQLNLFMYQVSPNAGWKNVALPSYSSKGERISNPPLALDLHYLLTAYGSNELHTDILLGYGMQLIHENMVLSREAIRVSLAPPSTVTGNGLNNALKMLSTSDLAEQAEMIKISAELLSIEDISKLWAAFGTKYRPTAAYKVTVVLIESSKSTKPSLPVKERNIYTVPFKKPDIEIILSQTLPGGSMIENQKILHNYGLVLRGKYFDNEIVQVKIDGENVLANTSNLTVANTEITFALPAGLNAGLHELQVVHPRLMGTPPEIHAGVSSAVAGFVLSPTITSANVTGTGNAATVHLHIIPGINTGQKAILYLNELSAGGVPKAYSFPVPAADPLSPPASPGDIAVPVGNIKKATYLIRIQIDGAESPLLTNPAGNYTSPVATIT